MRNLIITIALLYVACVSQAQCKIDKTNWVLAFEENFDNTTIAQLSSRWMFKHDDPGFGWGDCDLNHDGKIGGNDNKADFTHRYDNAPTDPDGDGRYTTQYTTSYQTYNPDESYGEYYDQSQVSLLPGGYLRLTAQRLASPVPIWSDWRGWRHPIYKSGMIQLKRTSSGTTGLTPHQFDYGTAGPNNDPYGGFRYGMFEIRMKVPNGCAFPAFWLIGPSQFNVYEGAQTGHTQTSYMAGFNREWAWDPGRMGSYEKLGPGLDEDFHVYTGVWTPNKITFFFDGRELATYTGNDVNDLCPWTLGNSMIVSMQMNGWCGPAESTKSMDIDYIRVYRPTGNYGAGSVYGYDNTTYKTLYTTMPHDAMGQGWAAPSIKVSRQHGSIATNPNTPQEVFYRGSDDRLYCAKYTIYSGNSGLWSFTKLEYNDGATSANADVASDLCYVPYYDIIVYKGKDGRIQFFGRSNSTACGWYHWYIDDDWAVQTNKHSPTPGSLVASPDGQLFYKGFDSKVHRFYVSSGDWIHQTIGIYNSTNLVSGDIAVENAGNNVYYRGVDEKLHSIYKNSSGVYTISNFATSGGNDTKMSSRPGTLCIGQGEQEVYYVGTDNKFHMWKYNAGTWGHSLLNYSYMTGLGYPEGDKPINSLVWDDATNRIAYCGFDGRMQVIGKGTTWSHWWIDDYWNTPLYASNNFAEYSTTTPKLSSVSQNSFGTFYRSTDDHLRYFSWEACEVLNPATGSSHDLNRNPNHSAPSEYIMNQESAGFTTNNPVGATLKISGLKDSTPQQYRIFDLTGKLVLSGMISSDAIDVSSLNTGNYIIVLPTAKARFVKE